MCEFSNKENGDFVAPSPGCKLSKMITVSGVMNVSGVEGEEPLRELAAMGGTPDANNPKRHFFLKNEAELSVSYLKLTGGKVDTASSTNSEDNAGGSIYASGLNTLLSLLEVIFTGCGESNNCARRGGAVYAEINAQVTIDASKFLSCNSDQEGGAIAAIGGAKVMIQRTEFKNNKVSQYGGAIYNALKVGSVATSITLIGGDNVFDGNHAGLTGEGHSIYKESSSLLEFDVCPPGTLMAADNKQIMANTVDVAVTSTAWIDLKTALQTDLN